MLPSPSIGLGGLGGLHFRHVGSAFVCPKTSIAFHAGKVLDAGQFLTAQSRFLNNVGTRWLSRGAIEYLSVQAERSFMPDVEENVRRDFLALRTQCVKASVH